MWIEDLGGKLVNLDWVVALMVVSDKERNSVKVLGVLDPSEDPITSYYAFYNARDEEDAFSWVSQMQRRLNGLNTDRVLH